VRFRAPELPAGIVGLRSALLGSVAAATGASAHGRRAAPRALFGLAAPVVRGARVFVLLLEVLAAEGLARLGELTLANRTDFSAERITPLLDPLAAPLPASDTRLVGSGWLPTLRAFSSHHATLSPTSEIFEHALLHRSRPTACQRIAHRASITVATMRELSTVTDFT
jgi:hypothetical protein